MHKSSIGVQISSVDTHSGTSVQDKGTRRIGSALVLGIALMMVVLDILLDTLILDQFGQPILWPAFIVLIIGAAAITLICLRGMRREKSILTRYEDALGQLRAVADNLPGALFQWFMTRDGDCGFRYISQRAEELFGINVDEVCKDWKKIHIHPGDLSRWAETLRRCRDTMQDWNFEGRIIHPSGEVQWLRCMAKLDRGKEGEVIFNGIILDVTDAKDAEREIKEIRRNAERLGAEILLVNQSLNESNDTLKRINRQKNEILGVAAHDLKNPLGGVVGFAGAMRASLDEEQLDPIRADLVDMTDSIEQSARHMLNIINGLLNASALEDGAVQLEMSPCDMEALAKSVESMNEAASRRKDIKVQIDSEPDCVVNGDPQRLRELLDNIVSNAIKYSQNGQAVAIRVYHSGPSYVQVSVRDEGPGLTDDDKTKLFGKFQKLSARPTGGESSTGLGLAIAKSIVELHGGKIWAESEYGKGSTFYIELPVNPPKQSCSLPL